MSSVKKRAPVTRVAVRVQPNAARSQVVGFQDDVLRVRVAAPAREGRANRALVDLLAESLGVPRSAVTILRGQTSRDKVVEVRGATPESLRELAP